LLVIRDIVVNILWRIFRSTIGDMGVQNDHLAFRDEKRENNLRFRRRRHPKHFLIERPSKRGEISIRSLVSHENLPDRVRGSTKQGRGDVARPIKDHLDGLELY
jgi:hypothetical protein